MAFKHVPIPKALFLRKGERAARMSQDHAWV